MICTDIAVDAAEIICVELTAEREVEFFSSAWLGVQTGFFVQELSFFSIQSH